ncbi:trafficking protein particle complex subunit 4 [Pancytospora philotis]|nr:trafficking protein particle complex subunit 4 [Pancytospora philotis]
MVEQFFIINSSGGMIYKHEAAPTEDVNSALILTSTLHSINEMTRSVFQTKARTQVVQMERTGIHLFRTLTNLMFVFVVRQEAQQPAAAEKPGIIFPSVYRHFCDCVMANPFYKLHLPICCAKFKPEQFFG